MKTRTIKYYRSRVLAELKKFGKSYVLRKYGQAVFNKVAPKVAAKAKTVSSSPLETYVRDIHKAPNSAHSGKNDKHVAGKGGIGNPAALTPAQRAAQLAKLRGAFAKEGSSAPDAQNGWGGPGKRSIFSAGGEIPEGAQAFKRQMNFNLDNDSDLAQGSQHQWAQPTSISNLISGQLRLASNQPIDALQTMGATSISNRQGSPFGFDATFSEEDMLAQSNPMGAFGTPGVMYDLGESPEEMEYALGDDGKPTRSSTQAEKTAYFLSPEGRAERTEIGAQAFANKYDMSFKSGGTGIGGLGGTMITPKLTVNDKLTFGGFTERYGAGYENVMPGTDFDKYDLDDYKSTYGSARVTVSDADRQLWMSIDPDGYKSALNNAKLAETNAIDKFAKNFPDSKDVLKDSGAIGAYNTAFKKAFSQYYNGQYGDIAMQADGTFIPKPTPPAGPGTGPGTGGTPSGNPPLPMYDTNEDGGMLPGGFTSTSSTYNPWGSLQGADNNMFGPSQGTMGKATMDAMALANAYFAPQRAELAYELGDMETDMRRLAVNLGRQVDDPVLQAKLYKEGMRAVRTLDVQQNTFAFQMADARRKEELSNWQFYDQLAQNEAQLRLANWQFTQNMDLEKSKYNLNNWIAMNQASSMGDVGGQAPATGSQSQIIAPSMKQAPLSNTDIYGKRLY